MNPVIGTRYLAFSDEGVYLDAPSVARLRDRAKGKPTPKIRAINDPKPPSGAEADKAMVAYRSALARNQAGRERHATRASEFEHIPFVWGRVDNLFKGRVIASDVRILAHMRRQNGEELRADIVTGSLYNAAGICLSSCHLIVADMPDKKPPTQKQRVAYLDARLKGVEGEE